MPEREYEVYEPMKGYNVFVVRARNQREAVEKVLAFDGIISTHSTNAAPMRPLVPSDARRAKGSK
jgi:hypothetical protein